MFQVPLRLLLWLSTYLAFKNIWNVFSKNAFSVIVQFEILCRSTKWDLMSQMYFEVLYFKKVEKKTMVYNYPTKDEQ